MKSVATGLGEDDFIDLARRVLRERGVEVARSDLGRVYDALTEQHRHGSVPAAAAVRVCDLSGGDVVELGGRQAVFIGAGRHPRYPSLWLVVWRMETGEISLDALHQEQEVGSVVSDPTGWRPRLERALGKVE